jgi:hypothetical protein
MRLTKRGRVPGAPIYSSPYPPPWSYPPKTLVHISFGIEAYNKRDISTKLSRCRIRLVKLRVRKSRAMLRF